jgi:hypothetical protein
MIQVALLREESFRSWSPRIGKKYIFEWGGTSMLRKWLMVVALALVCAPGQANAGLTTINFDNAPNSLLYFGGATSIGSYYAGNPAGPTFGTDATILDAVNGGYNSSGYPYSSPYGVLFTAGTGVITVDFTTGKASTVGFDYNNPFYGLTVDVYAGGSLLDSQSLTSPYGGPPGTYSFNAGSETITKVVLTGLADFYTIDNFNYNTTAQSVPEPASLTLLGLGAVALAGFGLRCYRRS